MKIFLNNKKMPLIPLLFHNNEYITDFKEKAELFNLFFIKQYSLLKNENDLIKQCSLLKNGNDLPTC